MRIRAIIEVVIHREDELSNTRDGFWRANSRRARIPEETVRNPREFGEYRELFLRTEFPIDLQRALRDSLGETTVIIRQISYHSLEIVADVITGTLANVGLTPDDVIALLSQYVPAALDRSMNGLDNLSINVNAQVLDATPSSLQADAASISNQSRNQESNRPNIDRVWLIANTSLVLPSVVLIIAAFFIFKFSGDERNQLTQALIQERIDLSAQRQKLVEGSEAGVRLLEDHLSAETKHLHEIYDLETALVKAGLARIEKQDVGHDAASPVMPK